MVVVVLHAGKCCGGVNDRLRRVVVKDREQRVRINDRKRRIVVNETTNFAFENDRF